MPRRKPKGEEHVLNNEVLMLPPPRPTHRREHDIDPYATLPGAMPVTQTSEPIKRKMTQADLANRKAVQSDMRMKAARYHRYLDELIDQQGDQAQALAVIYGVPVEQARLRLDELQADVRSGMGATQLAEVLERNDLTLASRMRLLRKHAYSPNPAASLKAIDMVAEAEGDRQDVGSFESFLRLVKASKA